MHTGPTNSSPRRLAGTVATVVAMLALAAPAVAGATSAPPAPGGGNSQNALFDATKTMQETQLSFDLQHLQSQTAMGDGRR